MLDPNPAIRLVTDQADALLKILDKRNRRQPIDQSDWQVLFKSDGFRRLADREAFMNVPIDKADFKDFATSDALLQQASELRASLDLYSQINLESLVEKTRAYLPPEANLRGTIYPVIKPKPNSFIYELRTDPAIFLAVKPWQRLAKLENTLIHELHHWGLASCHADEESLEDGPDEEKPLRFARYVLSAFGEGFAMLAAAGGPEAHPHLTSTADEREEWDRSMSGFDDDLKKLEGFLLDVLNGNYETQEALFESAMAFFGVVQGPWYTVDWKMAQAIELHRGKETLMECMHDPRRLIVLFNEIANERPQDMETSATWSTELLERLGSD